MLDNYHYGAIGNCQSAALVSRTGSIDWCCLPDFDSPSVFAKLLDEHRGGSFAFEIDPSYRIIQSYEPKTNILFTKFDNGTDAFGVFDFMPRYLSSDTHTHSVRYFCPPDVVRYVKRLRGEPRFTLRYDPKLAYAEFETRTENQGTYLKSTTTRGAYESVYLYSDFNLDAIRGGTPILLEQDGFIMLSHNQKLLPPTLADIELSYQKTKTYWMDWSANTNKHPQYNEAILRSSLALKLMTYDKTGAVLAALTTSLPETIGECRNWDYRFCWIRDASMTINVLAELGDINAIRSFVHYILSLVNYKDEKIQIMYGIRGQKQLTERELSHLAGYMVQTRPHRQCRVRTEAERYLRHPSGCHLQVAVRFRESCRYARKHLDDRPHAHPQRAGALATSRQRHLGNPWR